jgi:hypothetical protein
LMIHASSSLYLSLVFLLIFLINQVRRYSVADLAPQLAKLRCIILYHQCLLTFSSKKMINYSIYNSVT